MEEKAQGAIEYLLIIGAAIIVVAIVIIMILGIMESTEGASDQAQDEITSGYDGLSDMLNGEE